MIELGDLFVAGVVDEDGTAVLVLKGTEGSARIDVPEDRIPRIEAAVDEAVASGSSGTLELETVEDDDPIVVDVPRDAVQGLKATVEDLSIMYDDDREGQLIGDGGEDELVGERVLVETRGAPQPGKRRYSGLVTEARIEQGTTVYVVDQDGAGEAHVTRDRVVRLDALDVEALEIVAEVARARIDEDGSKIGKGWDPADDLGYRDYSFDEAWDAVEDLYEAVSHD